MVWEAADVLARVLAGDPGLVAGKRVLELGCGCALAGLAAGALGAARVTLTDRVLYMAEYNVAANFGGPADRCRL